MKQLHKGLASSKNIYILIGILLLGLFAGLILKKNITLPQKYDSAKEGNFVPLGDEKTTEEEWKQKLEPQEFQIMRQKGTETPYTSPLLNEKRAGTYVTADCGQPVFRSEHKYDSGTGWPSFWMPIEGAVKLVEDNSLGISRIEVVGTKCGTHLGHVFDDGPSPTFKRYCINGLALKFVPDDAITTK